MGLANRHIGLLLAGVALGALSAGEAMAQTLNANATNVTLLERLVIGAGNPKVAIATPQAVTVVDQDDIDSQQATTIGEIFDAVPGTTMVGSDRILGQAFNIRGIGAVNNSADGSRIVVTVDGAPKFNEQYRMGSFFSDPELYKSIEVLRGPASSTLYGSGALGGVINFVTKDASDFIADGATGAVRIKGGYDSNGNGALASALIAHRINETFDILATGSFRRSDAFTLADGSILSGSDFETWSGLIKGTARFGQGEEQTVRLSWQHWDSDADDQDYVQTGTESLGGVTNAFGTVDRHVTDDTFVLSYENPASDNPWLDLKVALSYSDTRNSQSNHKPGSPVSFAPGMPPMPVAPTGPGDTGSTAILNDTDYGYATWQLKADNTIEWIGNGLENYLTIGSQISTQHRTAGRPEGTAALQQHPEGIEDKLGLFVQNETIFNNDLTVIAGARADLHHMTPLNDIAGATEIEGVALSPKLAAFYQVNDTLGIFGSVAHTERFPTLDELYSYSATRGLSLGLEKESSNNFELGFSTSAYDVGGIENTVALKTTAFVNDITNAIRTNPAPSGAGGPYYVNLEHVRLWGIEVEASYESELVFGRLAYTHTLGEFVEGYSTSSSTINPGDPLTSVPQDKLALTIGARAPEWNLEYGARAIIAAEGETAVTSSGTAEAYATADLFASWKPHHGAFAGTEAQFSIENVFDADYRENLSTDRSKGRTFKLTLARQFDY
ncbi:TonB-dependent receptor [Arsenicitalea aurantiaca]|uniref:TonB-dependent receptor n=1 Tax=Arsenicitalea aurantiaca TaxID=1783274 RepID=A0A433X8M5_9HYPH|nr:TonB-dependent receptor [Arsenicitalea aurantiaca]RUT30388.1 TonB-dependent receptor [Arsenicitalea aurantiaca]